MPQLPDSLSPERAGEGRTPAPPPPTRLFLVRHGQSTWNRERRIQGPLDPPARRLAGRHFAGFYSSDLKRALETAGAIAAAIGSQAEPTPSLREIYLGD